MALVNNDAVFNESGSSDGGGDAEKLEGQTGAYYLDRANHTSTQAIATVTGLQTSLDGKAATNHMHAIADVTNLQTSLDGKESTANKATSLTSPDNTKYPTTLAVATALAGVGGGGVSHGKQVGGYISGRITHSTCLSAGMSNISSGANNVRLSPFIPAADLTINAIGFIPNADTGILKFAAYDAAPNGSPLNLLFETAQATSTGNVGVPFLISKSYTFLKGKLYWLQIRTATSLIIPTLATGFGLHVETFTTAAQTIQTAITKTQIFALASPAVFDLDLATMPDANRTSGATPYLTMRVA